MRPRTTLVAAIVAMAAICIWYVLRAPLVAKPVAATPVADAASTADSARRDAAIDVARMPDDPWTFAESLAPSAPASAPAKSHCGADEEPVFAEPVQRDGRVVVDPIRPAGPDYVAATQRVDAALRASADPFDRAAADWLNVGDVRTPAQRQDLLVQEAATTSDPRVYALAYRTCAITRRLRGSCQLLSARQWANLDAGNAMPWLYLYDQATLAGDPSGQQEAMAHMASASHFDDHTAEVAGAVAAQVPQDEDGLAPTLGLATHALGMAAAQGFPAGSLMNACRDQAGGDANRAQQCQAVSDVMFEHGTSLAMRGMGGALFFEATGDSSRRDVARAERVTFGAHWSPATGFSECQQIRDGLKRMVRSAKLGELEAAREESRTFVTP